MTEERVKASAFIVQGLSTLCIANLTCIIAYIYAWPSYTLANFTSNQTILSKPMNSLEVSMVGSVTNIGALIATPFCGYAVNTIGRRYAAMLFGVPFVLSWSIISVTKSVIMVIAAIGLAGVGAAGQVVSSIYIAEISQDSIRGGLTSTTVSGYFTGLLFSYILGTYLTYYQVVYVHLGLSVMYILLLALLKESPVYLVQTGREEDAAKSIAFYRRLDPKSKEVEVEIRKIKLQLDPRIEDILQGENDPEVTNAFLINDKPAEQKEKVESSWKFFWKSESSKRALWTVLTLMTVSILMGGIVLQVYAEPLFKEVIPSMSPSVCAILLAIDLLASSLLCAVVVDRFGRKSLMTSTAAMSGVLTLLLGAQLHLHWAPHWATAVLIYAYTFIYTLGAAIVPFILTAEVFLPEVRGLCNSFAMGCMWIMNFVTLMIFTLLVEFLGLGPLYYFFSAMCFLGAVYSHFYLPETKGLSSDAIQLLFLKKDRRRQRKNKW